MSLRFLLPAAALLGAVACAGPAPGPADCGVPATGRPVVLLVPATSYEPRPSITPAVEQLLRAAADVEARDGRGAPGAVALVASADGAAPEALPLTPRRPNCAVEPGCSASD